MYGSHCNPSTPDNAPPVVPAASKLTLVPVTIDRDHHEVRRSAVTVEQFWADDPHATYYLCGR